MLIKSPAMNTPWLSPLTRVATQSAGRWTCSSCRSQVIPRAKTALRPLNRQYGTGSSRYSRQTPKSKKIVLTATATGAAGAGVLAFTDDIKFGYEATERAGRVASALYINISE